MYVFPSIPPEATHWESGENFAQLTALEWFFKVWAAFPVLISQTLTLVSPEPVSKR